MTNLQRRTVFSFAIFFAAMGLLYIAWYKVNDADYIDDTPAPYRHVLEFNGRIWKALYRAERTSLAQSRIPPGKAPRVNGDIGMDNPVDLEHWTLTLQSGDRKLSLTMADLKFLPRTESSTQLRCIEGWSEDISYAGVKFSDLMKAYNLSPKAYVGLETEDREYYVSIDIESMLHEQTILAYEMNGAPLKAANGQPLRLVIPVKYGIKHLKRIGKIFFSDERPPDYWAERGYDWYAGL